MPIPSTRGQSQRKQAQVVHAFKTGAYNTLVATSIGEEGLDIGEVELIVMYDASGSPIRAVQRIGRTGRKGVGRCVAIVARGAEQMRLKRAFSRYRAVVSVLQRGGFRMSDGTMPPLPAPACNPRIVRVDLGATGVDDSFHKS